MNARPRAGELTPAAKKPENSKTSEALKIVEERYRNILNSIEDGYYETDLAGNFTFCSDVLCRISGYSRDELLNANFRKFMNSESNKSIKIAANQVFRTKAPVKGFAYDRILKSGEKLSVETSISPICDPEGVVVGFRGMIRDVSERKTFEKKLHQSQKMEAIGTLAGGIAHDFNNLLAVIMGNTELALEMLPEASPAAGLLQQSVSACLKAKGVILDLLNFARDSGHAQKPVMLAPIVRDAMALLRSSLPAGVSFNQKFVDDVRIVKADPDQIRQIVVNLAINAHQAMEKTGGTLSVSVENATIPDLRNALINDLNPGDYVKLVVRDTGSGIDPKNLDRIFDPYFTTREVGKGSGLGLAAVLGIVKSHGGSILVESRLKQGTDISLFFPVIEQENTDNENAEAMPSGNECILFVDDEEMMTDLNRARLERLGYRVETENDSAAALARITANPDHFDLVITDMTMPVMTGDILSAEIRKIKPGIPVILCTGFSEKIDAKKAEEIGIDAFMMKPVGMGHLARTVRKELDRTK